MTRQKFCPGRGRSITLTASVTGDDYLPAGIASGVLDLLLEGTRCDCECEHRTGHTHPTNTNSLLTFSAVGIADADE